MYQNVSYKILFGVSLAANAFAAAYILIGAGPDQKTMTAAPAANQSIADQQSVALRDVLDKVDTDQSATLGSVESIIEILRASGASPDVLIEVARAMIESRYTARRFAILRGGANYEWQRIGTGQKTPEQKKALFELSAEMNAELRTLLGEDFDRAGIGFLRYSPGYRNLSEEKLSAAAKILNDYREIRAEALRREGGSGFLQTEATTEAEMNADLRALMSPEEFTQHTLYESKSARQLAYAMSETDINDATFVEILSAVQALPVGQWFREVRRVGGDSAAVEYLKKSERGFSEGIQSLQTAGMSASSILRMRESFEKTFPKANDTYVDFVAIYNEMTSEMTPEQVQVFISTPVGRRIKGGADLASRGSRPP